jgi:inosine-uridine nucleoside N-ribohydrolase
MVRELIIDTDGGVDDCVAIWAALAHPGVEVVAITTTDGSVAQPAATTSVLTLLEAAGRTDIPVAAGVPGTAGPAPGVEPAAFIHGEDGQGNTFRTPSPGHHAVDVPAVELLRRMVAARPGTLSVLTLGPLTNLGHTLQQDPDWAAGVDELVVMGGALAEPGNAQPAGEANIAGDPVAAHLVAAAPWCRPPLLVPLDVTYRATLRDEEFDLLAQRKSPAAAFLDEPLRFYRPFGSTFTAPECPCHDLLAFVALADPEVLTDAPVLPLAIETSGGPAWGATIADRRQPYFERRAGSTQPQPDGFSPWRIGLGVDVDRFRAHVTTLFGA